MKMWVLVKGDADGRRHPVGIFDTADLAKAAADVQTLAYALPPLNWHKYRGAWSTDEAPFGGYEYNARLFTVNTMQDSDDK